MCKPPTHRRNGLLSRCNQMNRVAELSQLRGTACEARYRLQFDDIPTTPSWSAHMRRIWYPLLAVVMFASCSRNEPARNPAPTPTRPAGGGAPPTAAADRPAGTPQD